mmetsp:Transcript_13704/g.37899  ORF Transcript_13704/g.37899 Transcript_13704/m.37899 type:complete len:456 (-) Transcript_13704:111-1478(-)
MDGFFGFLRPLRRTREDFTGYSAERARADKAEALREGTYYSTAGDVISLGQEVSLREVAERTDFDAIQRSFEHPYYQTAIAKARDFGMGMYHGECKADDRTERHKYGPDTASLASSLQSSEHDSDTTKNRKRKLKQIAVTGRAPSQSAKIAHLIPHSFGCANYYRRLVWQMTGIQFSTTTTTPPQGWLRHLRNREDNAADEAAAVLVHGLLQRKTRWGEWRRVRDTGVKHNCANMARVFAQKYYFDMRPKFLIIPIKTLSDVLRYTGGSFEVILLASDPDVYRECQVTNETELATYPELETAVKTLRSFVKACAYDAVENATDHNYADLHQPERRLVSNGVNQSRPHGPLLPHLLASEEDVKSGRVRVGKVRFSKEIEEAHQECDPYALFLKAVAVESSMQGEKLLPCCPALHDCEICMEQGLTQCHCDFYDPTGDGVPEEITIIQQKKKPRNQI